MGFIKNHKILVCIIIFILFWGGFLLYRNTRDTSDHYVNSLYKSDERIYHEFLDKDDKKLYDLILDSSIKHRTNVELDLDEYHCKNYSECGSKVAFVNDALYVDHPELMSYAGYSWIYYRDTFTLHLPSAYFLSYKDYYGVLRIEAILSKMEKETKNMTDQEKIIYVYDWIGDHNSYDYYFTFTSKNQSIYNVFIKKNAVCAGFAKAAQIIFSRIGIKSYIVGGETDDYHMWNMIEYEGNYYYFDSTVAVVYKKGTKHYYEGIKQKSFKNYSVTHPNWYPTVSKENMFEI